MLESPKKESEENSDLSLPEKCIHMNVSFNKILFYNYFYYFNNIIVDLKLLIVSLIGALMYSGVA